MRRPSGTGFTYDERVNRYTIAELPEPSRARLRIAGVREYWFDRTWDPKYLERFGVGDVINDVIPVGADLEPDQIGFILLSEAEKKSPRPESLVDG